MTNKADQETDLLARWLLGRRIEDLTADLDQALERGDAASVERALQRGAGELRDECLRLRAMLCALGRLDVEDGGGHAVAVDALGGRVGGKPGLRIVVCSAEVDERVMAELVWRAFQRGHAALGYRLGTPEGSASLGTEALGKRERGETAGWTMPLRPHLVLWCPKGEDPTAPGWRPHVERVDALDGDAAVEAMLARPDVATVLGSFELDHLAAAAAGREGSDA